MIKNQLFIAAALFVGVAIGYIMKPDAKPETVDDKGYVAAAKIADEGEAASVKALRARIAKLEKLLAASEVKARGEGEQTTEAKPVEEARVQRFGPPSMKEMRERLEKLKKENPEEYARREKAMAQFRQRHLDRTNQKLEFLSSIDTAGMTDEQKQAHEKYQDLIARRAQLEEKMHNLEMTDEDRQNLFREMHETNRAMREAARAERQTLIDQATKALGFTGDEAAAVSSTISDIVSSTEQGHGFGPPPPDGGGPR